MLLTLDGTFGRISLFSLHFEPLHHVPRTDDGHPGDFHSYAPASLLLVAETARSLAQSALLPLDVGAFAAYLAGELDHFTMRYGDRMPADGLSKCS